MTLFLLLVLAAVVLGVVGVVVEGLLYLLALGSAVLLVALILGAVQLRQGGRRPSR